jgi:monolysocardiolipin acyltransferase
VGGHVDGKVNDDDDDGAIRIIPATARQRSLPPSPIGKLKWGVGKLIAHAPITPVVMPFAHVGMERLLPQDEYTGKTRFRENALRSLLPTFLGGDDTDRLRVKVRFGEEVHFDDLIRDHETRYGRLWKYHGEDIDEYDIDDDRSRRESWRSSEEERVLYGKIVRRIEGRLDALTRDVCREEGVY